MLSSYVGGVGGVGGVIPPVELDFLNSFQITTPIIIIRTTITIIMAIQVHEKLDFFSMGLR
uniref:Uncharacterized protein n=1 Tax=Pithovirus LCPAC202 TaxID=2506592 RepID=A0A481Z7U4_9VIRU|nr:MAG: hypothetical protein LCPAC202_01630 [Pithovirus LCPAC202]